MKHCAMLLLALLIGVTGMAQPSPAAAEVKRATLAEKSARVVKGFESLDRLTVRKDQRGQTFWNEGPFTVGPDSRRDDAGSRSFWSFDISRLDDKKVLSAELMTVETSSGSCLERPVQVWRTSRISARSTWRDQPEWQRRLDTRMSAQGYSSDCPMGALHFNVTAGLRFAVNHDRDLVHLGLRSGDESDPKSWKRFQASSYLSVKYLTPPTAPTDLRLADPSTVCGTVAEPTAIGDSTPRLSMLLKNPDAGNAELDVEVEVFDGAVTQEPLWSITTDQRYQGGATAQVGIPEGVLVDGSTYFFRARTYYWFGTEASVVSDWSSQCWFTVDTTPPPVPAVSSDFPECTEDACVTGPRTGVFYFSSESPDVVQYRYQLNSTIDYVGREVPGELAQREVTLGPGLHVMEVRSVDGAGNVSPSVVYQFLVG